MIRAERATQEGGHRRRAAAVITAPLVAVMMIAGLSVAPAGAADPGAEAAFVSATNSLRASVGAPPLEVHGVLVAKARAWAEQMAAAGGISHSQLSDGITVAWHRLGENVGMGPGVQAIQDAFVASPSHYQNLTDPGFRFVGVGVVNAAGTMYVAVEFMEVASQPAPETSASAAGTPTSPPEPAAATPAAAPAAPPPPPEPLRDALPAAPPRLDEMLAAVRTLEAA